ncbi:hypothetical protein [Candidatus Cyanaurora vandensis]|uniref:hypothetical protein n=1 Tax=Candidatus Cyanaurora vandensis TaxID=2714958 RepID=UPI00257B68A2|nr:hypothetical protein [Candidatus Cyanaurora vandensis]
MLTRRLFYFILWTVLLVAGWVPMAQAGQIRVAAVSSPTYYVWVPASRRTTLKLKQVVPQVLARRSKGRRYLQAGAFRDGLNAQVLTNRLKQQGLAAFIRVQAPMLAQVPPIRPPQRIAALATVPTLPLTQTLINLPTIPVAEPSPYVPMTRVLVPAQDYQRSAELQQQVNGAFQRQWQGQTYIQVGAFSRPENVQQMVIALQQLGLNALVQGPEF